MPVLDASQAYLRRYFISRELEFRQQPLLLYQPLAFFFAGWPSLWAFLGVTVAVVIASRLLTHALVLTHDLQARRLVLKNLREFPGTVAAYTPYDIFGAGGLAPLADTVFHKMGSRMRHRQFARAMKLIHFFVREPPPGGPTSTPFVAYPLRLSGYIFLRDHPADLRGAARFMVLHELGHMSLLGNYYAIRARIATAPYLLVFFVAASQSTGSMYSSTVLWGYFLLCIALGVYWSLRRDEARMLQEVVADALGLFSLEKHEALRTIPTLRNRRISDSNLSERAEQVRRHWLLKSLDDIEAGHPEPIWFPNLTGETPRIVWFAMGATGLLATTARPFDAGAAVTLAQVAIVVVLFLVAVGSTSTFLAWRIRRKVAQRAPAVRPMKTWYAISKEQRRQDMSDETRIARIVSFVLPEEADALGPGTLDDIIHGALKFEKPEGAQRFDLPWETIQHIAAVVTLLGFAFDVTRFGYTKLNRAPTVEEVTAEVKTKMSTAPAEPDLSRVTPEELSRLITAALLELQADQARFVQQQTEPGSAPAGETAQPEGSTHG